MLNFLMPDDKVSRLVLTDLVSSKFLVNNENGYLVQEFHISNEKKSL